jgi:hypothetical protein
LTIAQGNNKLKNYGYYVLRIAGWVIIFLLFIWILLTAYFYFNKGSLIVKIKAQINKQVKGKVEIKNIQTDFIHTFPFLSVKVSGVSIKDSLWSRHHHEFLKAENIYLRLQLQSLFSGKPQIGKLIVENGTIHLYTDTAGYTNLVKADDPATGKNESYIPDLEFKRVRFILQNDAKNKLHDFFAEHLFCDVERKGSLKLFKINIRSLVHQLTFNREKGGYLKEKVLQGKFTAVLTNGKVLELKKTVLKIDQHPFLISAIFNLGDEPKTFQLSIATKKISFQKTSHLLTTAIQNKIDSFGIDKPIDITAMISGEMAYKSIPLVKIDMQAKNAAIKSPAGSFTDCSFLAEFINEVDTAQPHVGENSAFKIKDFTGHWRGIPLTSKSIEITNLKTPFLKCDLKSAFALKNINDITESGTIQFTKGKGSLAIQYEGSIVAADTVPPIMNGEILLSDAVIKYLPRNFVLSNCDGRLVFKHHDLLIQKLNATAGSSRLLMDGSIKNFLALIDINPEKLVLEWNIFSPQINMNDFIGYLGKQQSAAVVKKKKKSKIIRIADSIDRMLKDGTANLSLKAGKLLYKKFNASNVTASLTLLANRLVLNNARLQHAGGAMNFKGSLLQNGNANQLSFNANLSRIDIPKIFYAFNNFGQDAVTDKNMKGNLMATIKLNAAITQKAEIIGESLNGNLTFSVKDGELINFGPVIKIGETAFKKRDFSHMRFAELKDKMRIEGSAIYMDKMEIRSNVIKLFVEGVYDTKNGTDMSIQIPLTNLSKDDHEILKNKGRAGVNIRLRAKTADDGTLKVSWDPFNKAEKKRKDTATINKPEEK